MGSRHAVPLVLAVAFGLAACENSLGPESVRSIEIAIDRTTLTEGEHTSIGVSASDIDGGSISGSEVTWISRDPSTVRVEDGALIAVAPGVTTIVADVRGARDSVRIRVRFAALARGDIGVRLQGSGGVRNASDGYTVTYRRLTLDDFPSGPFHTSIQTRLSDGAVSNTGAADAVFAESDTLVMVIFHDPPEVGARQFDAFEPDTLNGTFILRGAEGALVRIVDSDDPLRTEIYTPVGDVDLEIDEVVFPDEPGLGGGLMRGAVAFEAAGIVMRLDTAAHTVSIEGPASDTTLHVYVEFETDLYEMLTGSARVELTQNGSTVRRFSSASAWMRAGGAEFTLAAPTEPQTGELPTELLSMYTRIEATGAGTIPVQALDGDTFDWMAGAPGTWSYLRTFPVNQTVLHDDDVTGHGYSTGSQVTLTEYRAPTGTLFGLMRGIYEISYAMRDENNEPTGKTIESTTEFLLPIQPTCGLGDPDCS
jgi:hypothetical protein